MKEYLLTLKGSRLALAKSIYSYALQRDTVGLELHVCNNLATTWSSDSLKMCLEIPL